MKPGDNFQLTVNIFPIEASNMVLKNLSGRKAQVRFKKISGVQGYEIIYTTDNKMKKGKKVVRSRKNVVTIKKLAKNRRYYIKVRGYRIDSTGDRIYGKYSKAGTVRIKR